jgi:hypothetical protein
MRRYEEDDDSPFDRNGILKDGRKATWGMMAMDQRVSVIDAGQHRPGFRVGDADMRDAKQQARDAYEKDLVNAWRGGGRKITQRDPQGRLMSTLEEEEEDVTDALPARKGMTVDQMRHDHERNMSNIYQAYERSLVDAWRKP